MTRQLYLLGTEQPDSDWFHSNLVIAPDARAMLDINPLGVEGYRARGLRCFHLPLGYHPMLAARSIPPTIEREIDICLLASLTERREKFLAAHADFFASPQLSSAPRPARFCQNRDDEKLSCRRGA